MDILIRAKREKVEHNREVLKKHGVEINER